MKHVYLVNGYCATFKEPYKSLSLRSNDAISIAIAPTAAQINAIWFNVYVSVPSPWSAA